LQENCVVWFGMDPSWYNNKAIIGIWPQMNWTFSTLWKWKCPL
jgi:hypothetical protein